MVADSQPVPLKRTTRVSLRAPQRRVKLIALASAAFVALVAGGTFVYRRYTDPRRIRALAEARLQQYTRGVVVIDSAEFSWLDGVRLFDVAVWEPGFEPREASAQRQPQGSGRPASPAFSCREVHLLTGRLSALFGSLETQAVVAVEPTCTIVRDMADGRTNLSGLLRLPDPASLTAPARLPVIELRDARVRVVSRDSGKVRVLEDLKLTVRARPSPADADVYDVVWHGGNGRKAVGHSRIDLKTGRMHNVEGGLPWMSIEAVMMALNARYDGAGAWCDLLGLDGTVRATDYDFNPAADFSPPEDTKGIGSAATAGQAWAAIELSDASISIPINKQEGALPPEQRYLRFDGVDGRVQLTPDGIRAEFTGRFHGSECEVSAAMRGGVSELITLDDVDFDARLSVRGLELPRRDPAGPPSELRFINRWHQLAGFYTNYDPHGRMDLEIEVAKRAGEEQPITVRRAVLTAGGGDASCRYFPYRVRRLEGSVEYTPDGGVYIRDLRGTHAGGTVSIDGRLASPTRQAAKELRIMGRGIPIDEALASALPRRVRRLHEKLDPKGRIDVDIRLSQPAGTKAAPAGWRSRSAITLRDVSASYVGFPYRVDHLTGTIVITNDGVQVLDVAGRSGRAQITVGGTATFGARASGAVDLAIRGRNIPLDDALLAALPQSTRKEVAAFHPRGHFDVETSLSLDPDTGRLVHESQVTLKDAAVRYEKLPVELTGVHGRLDITRGKVVVEGLTARYREAIVTADGFLDRTSTSPSAEFNITATNLRVDEELRAALPPRLQRVLADWQIDGPIDSATIVRVPPAAAPQDTVLRTVVTLRGATIKHPFFPDGFRDVRGEITIADGVARGTDLQARYGGASVRVDFEARQTENGDEGAVTLSATGLALDDSLRGLLPERMAVVWDRLRPGGTIDLHLDSLLFRRRDDEHPREWSVGGYVECSDVALRGTPDIKRVSGTLVGSGSIIDRRGGTSLSGSLALASVDVFAQPLSNIKSTWSYASVPNGEGLLTLDAIRGHVHEGRLTGDVRVAFDRERADYELSLTVHGMQIEPFVNAGRASLPGDQEPLDARGLADGRLYLSGAAGDISLRRGGGRFEIVDGHIYRLPIILAILHVLNLSIPEEDAFDNVKAEFFVVGNRVEFTDLLLRGGVLGLVGSGSMTLPDCGVDLDLVNVGPRRWGRPLVLREFVDGISRELVSLHVTGPLSQPTVRARAFRSIGDELKRLFRKKKPKTIKSSGS